MCSRVKVSAKCSAALCVCVLHALSVHLFSADRDCRVHDRWRAHYFHSLTGSCTLPDRLFRLPQSDTRGSRRFPSHLSCLVCSGFPVKFSQTQNSLKVSKPCGLKNDLLRSKLLWVCSRLENRNFSRSGIACCVKWRCAALLAACTCPVIVRWWQARTWLDFQKPSHVLSCWTGQVDWTFWALGLWSLRLSLFVFPPFVRSFLHSGVTSRHLSQPSTTPQNSSTRADLATDRDPGGSAVEWRRGVRADLDFTTSWIQTFSDSRSSWKRALSVGSLVELVARCSSTLTFSRKAYSQVSVSWWSSCVSLGSHSRAPVEKKRRQSAGHALEVEGLPRQVGGTWGFPHEPKFAAAETVRRSQGCWLHQAKHVMRAQRGSPVRRWLGPPCDERTAWTVCPENRATPRKMPRPSRKDRVEDTVGEDEQVDATYCVRSACVQPCVRTCLKTCRLEIPVKKDEPQLRVVSLGPSLIRSSPVACCLVGAARMERSFLAVITKGP